MDKQPTRSKWRKLVKKLQRKRRRQKNAKDVDIKEREENESKLRDPKYQNWLRQQAQLDRFKILAEDRQHDEEEEAWLRRELIAQRNFRLEEERRKAMEAAKEAERLEEHKKLEEQEAAQRKRREERERLEAEAAAEFERAINKMEFYLSNEEAETPTELKRIIETRPGAKLCEFYNRTNCCNFGLGCTYNHRRPILARILLIHHFFTHPLLDQNEHTEYSTADSHLEMNERDLRADYDDFFEDVCSELETFGKIRNFRTVRNVAAHLKGNVFVEYDTKRSALKAFTALQGRFYAKKRLAIEFSNITRWRDAVCGLSITRNCARGLKCRYLHLFKNPGDKYNTDLEKSNKWSADHSTKLKSTPQTRTPLLSWDDVSPYAAKRNWRWSESPEPVEIPQKCSKPENPTRNKSKGRDRLEKTHSPSRVYNDSKYSTSDHIRKKRKRSKEKDELRGERKSRQS